MSPVVDAKSQSPRPNTKRTGELGEAAFVFKCAQLGFAVAKPWGDSERYDFILDAGHRTWRVQIKCTESLRANAYEVQSTYCDQNKKGHYTADDIDFLAAYIIPLDLWYIVPSRVLPESASLRFYPNGNISRKPRFEQYREAWDLFRQKPDKHRSRPASEAEAKPDNPAQETGQAVSPPDETQPDDPQPQSDPDNPGPEPDTYTNPAIRRMLEAGEYMRRYFNLPPAKPPKPRR